MSHYLLTITSIISCNAQNRVKERINSRVLLEKFLNKKLIAPCDYGTDMSRFFETKEFGSKSKVFDLYSNKISSDITLQILGYFKIGENDCIEHNLYLITKKDRVIDSLRLDYSGDSFGNVNLVSRVELIDNKANIYQTETEALYDSDKKKDVERTKKIQFLINKSGKIESSNVDSLPIYQAGKLYYFDEYFEEYHANLKLAKLTFFKVNNSTYAFVETYNKSSYEKIFFLFTNFNDAYFNKTYLIGALKRDENSIFSINFRARDNTLIGEVELKNFTKIEVLLNKSLQGDLYFEQYKVLGQNGNSVSYFLPNSKNILELMTFLKGFSKK